jgi:hypothetical protein
VIGVIRPQLAEQDELAVARAATESTHDLEDRVLGLRPRDDERKLVRRHSDRRQGCRIQSLDVVGAVRNHRDLCGRGVILEQCANLRMVSDQLV